MSEITKVPLEFAAKRRMQMSPTSWTAECSAHVAWAKGLIEMIHPAVTTEDWSLMDCQEYFVDLEMSLAGVATALEVSAPGQLRDDQMGVYRELELEVGVARGLANKLRARHLEAYDLQGRPVAFADSSGITEKLRAARLRLDEKLSAGLRVDHGDGPLGRCCRGWAERRAQESLVPHRRVRQSRTTRRKGHGRGSRVAWRTSRGSGKPGRHTSSASITGSRQKCW